MQSRFWNWHSSIVLLFKLVENNYQQRTNQVNTASDASKDVISER